MADRRYGIFASWVCRPCDVTGRDTEETEAEATCWMCGQPATIIARVLAELAGSR